jgi:hypothetical protein
MQRRADGMGAAQREVRRAGMAETGEAARALIALRARIVTGGLCAGGRLAEIPLAEEAALIGQGMEVGPVPDIRRFDMFDRAAGLDSPRCPSCRSWSRSSSPPRPSASRSTPSVPIRAAPPRSARR